MRMSQNTDEHGESVNEPWWMGNLSEPSSVDALEEDMQSVLFSS